MTIAMKIELSASPTDGSPKAAITSDSRLIRIEASTFARPTSVTVAGEHELLIEDGAQIRSLDAADCHVVLRGDFSPWSIKARSLESDGNLYPLFGMSIAGDVALEGGLTGERHGSYSVGGNLTARDIDVDGDVVVQGRVEVREAILARSLKSPHPVACVSIALDDKDTQLVVEESAMEPGR